MEKFGFIYKLVDNTNGNEYYGSTTRTVAQRVAGHRWNFKMYDGRRCASCNILKNGDWRYETVEKFTYNDKFELRNREQYYIENNECVNRQRAYNSPGYNKQRAKELRNREQYYIQNNECVNKKRASNTYRDKVKIFKKMQKAFTCVESLDNITIPENIGELYNDYMNCIRSRSKKIYDFTKIQDVRNCMVGIGRLLFGYSFYKKVGKVDKSVMVNGKRKRTETIIYDYDMAFIQLDEGLEELQMQIDDIQCMIDFYHQH